MSVDSYLALFTTLYGWAFYGVVWDVLLETGVVYLPFLGILLTNIIEPSMSQEARDATSTSLRRMQWDITIAFLVIVLAGQPFIALNAGILRYTPPPTPADPTPTPATVFSSGVTYGRDSFLGTPATVDVPIWWYMVMSLSAGVNHAILAGLPTVPDLRGYEQRAHITSMEDPLLRQETNEFFTQCYIPAKSKYLAEKPPTTTGVLTGGTIADLLDSYKEDDTQWLFSHVFRETPGYYDSLRSTITREGFPFVEARDTEWDPTAPPGDPMAPPPWGKPTCKQWWEDADAGLRRKLIAEGQGLWDWLVTQLPGVDIEKRQDSVVRSLLSNGPPQWIGDDYAHGNTNPGGFSTPENVVKDVIGGTAITLFSLLFKVMMNAILHALPMAQALILLGIYALLPLMIVFSRYSLNVIVVGAIAIFTVNFWAVLWHLAWWIDQNLIMSMYPDPSLFLILFSPAEQGTKLMLLNMLTTAIYLGLPLLWSAMMAWVGIHVGSGISEVFNALSGPARGAGEMAGSITRSAGKGVVSFVDEATKK